MATRAGNLSLLRLCAEYLRAILRLGRLVLYTSGYLTSPSCAGTHERCLNMPHTLPLTKTQEILLLFFLGSNHALDPIRIMKGLFLFNMKARPDWLTPEARYTFKAYSYGPYSSKLTSDLRDLSLKGYLTESQAPGQSWHYYSLTEQGRRTASENQDAIDPSALTYLHELRDYVSRLSFSALLKAVYKMYPEYAVNSVFKY
jgi:hypothetical protein